MVSMNSDNSGGNGVQLNTNAGVGTLMSRAGCWPGQIASMSTQIVEKGASQVIFYGKFKPLNEETFSLQFKYSNWAFLRQVYGVKAVAKSYSNWEETESWTTEFGVKSEFNSGKFLYSVNPRLIPESITVRRLSQNDYVSYSQNISVEGGEWVNLQLNNFEWVSSPGQFGLSVLTGQNSIFAEASFFNEYREYWKKSQEFYVKYAPSNVNCGFEDEQDSFKIIFSYHEPIMENGYLNKITLKNNLADIGFSISNLQVSTNTSGQTIEFTKSDNKLFYGSTDTGINCNNSDLYIICQCYLNGQTYDGTTITYQFSSSAPIIKSANLDYPNDGNNNAYLRFWRGHINYYENKNVCISINLNRELDVDEYIKIFRYRPSLHQY